MRTALTVGTVVALIRAAMAQNPTINTPTSLVQCQPALLNFSGGTAPYFISVLPGGQSAAAPLESLPEQTGTSYTWTVDIPAGTSITLSVRDSTGALNYSQQVTVQPGSSSCASGSGASSAAPSTAASASSAASSAGSASAASSASSALSSVASSASSRASSAISAASSASSASGPRTSSTGASTSASASAANPSASNSGADSLRVAGSGALALIGAVVMGLFA